MFSKKNNNFFHTIKFRLTLWYIILFLGLLTAVYFTVRYKLTKTLQKKTYNYLIERLDKCSVFDSSQKNDLEKIQCYFISQAYSEGAKSNFYILLSPDLKEIASSRLSQDHWSSIDFSKMKIPYIPNENETKNEKPNSSIYTNNDVIYFTMWDESIIALKTYSLPDRVHKMSIGFRKFKNGNILITGTSNILNELFINQFKKIFFVAILVILILGGLLGFFLARQAMLGVERTTTTAIQISKGDLSFRVPVKKEGLEIRRLAIAFNNMLEKIHSLVEELKQTTDNIAHDLRSPITRIRGVAETTLLRKSNVKEYEKMTASIIEECDDLVEMINTMLEIAETDAGVTKMNKSKVNLNEILREAFDFFQLLAKQKDINFQLKLPKKSLFTIGDKTKLQRVFANIIDNSVKYTSTKGKVQITAYQSENIIKITVTDTGIGIEEKDLLHIFDRFYRCDSSRSTTGNGLGLPLAKAIVKAHKGQISAESMLKKGSTFTVSLPLFSS